MLNCTQRQNGSLKKLAKSLWEFRVFSLISVAFAVNRFKVLYGDESLKYIFNISCHMARINNGLCTILIVNGASTIIFPFAFLTCFEHY